MACRSHLGRHEAQNDYGQNESNQSEVVAQFQLPNVHVKSDYSENGTPCDHDGYNSHRDRCQRGWVIEVAALSVRCNSCWSLAEILRHGNGRLPHLEVDFV